MHDSYLHCKLANCVLLHPDGVGTVTMLDRLIQERIMLWAAERFVRGAPHLARQTSSSANGRPRRDWQG